MATDCGLGSHQLVAESWVLRVAVYGKRCEYGLGSMKWISLAEAREMAREIRKLARQGGNPETVRTRHTMSFHDAAKRVHAAQLPTWKSEKYDIARRIRQRLSAIFDWAKTAGHYGGVARALPKITQQTEHMAALPWQELPDLMKAWQKSTAAPPE